MTPAAGRLRAGGRVALALLVALVVLPACHPSGGGPVAVPAARVTAEAASPTSIHVTWEAEQDPHRWWVVVSTPDGHEIGQRTTCGGCREQTLDDLGPASDYAVRVLPVDAAGGFGEFSQPVDVTTPPEPACAGVADDQTCVVVDASGLAGDAPGVGLGGLHGVTPSTDQSAVTALRPLAWRVAALDVNRFQLARSYGAQVTVLLSDAWIGQFGLAAPWSDWDRYESFVGAVVDAYIASGDLPDRWEVQNEPGPSAYEGGDAATLDLVAEQHERAAAVIHSKLPDAVVLGPSAAYARFGTGEADLERFAGLVGQGVLGGLSWHEIGGGCIDQCDGSPRAMLFHAEDVRAALQAAGAPAQGVELAVNEWGAPWNIDQPGAVAGYLAASAQSGVDVAHQTCWPVEGADACRSDPGTLDGLLLPDGRTPTDAWFVHQAYSQMTGAGFQLLRSTVADAQASVVATVDAGGTIRVLLGRHTGCDAALDPACPPGRTYGPDEPVTLVVPGVAHGYAVAVDRIDSVSGAGSRSTLARSAAPDQGGVVRADLGAVPDGAAVVVTLVPTT